MTKVSDFNSPIYQPVVLLKRCARPKRRRVVSKKQKEGNLTEKSKTELGRKKRLKSDEGSAPPLQNTKNDVRPRIKCCVLNCKTNQNDDLNFYPFPNDKYRLNWITATRYNKLITETTAVCAKHFLPENFKPSTSKLHHGTVPTQFLPPPSKQRRKILKEFSSDEDIEEKKDRKLGKKVTIVAKFDENDKINSSKIILNKIKPKGAGKKTNCLLNDLKNSFTLIKEIVEGLDITQNMQGVTLKPGEIEESKVVLTGHGGGPPRVPKVAKPQLVRPGAPTGLISPRIIIPSLAQNMEKTISVGPATIQDLSGKTHSFVYSIYPDPPKKPD